VLSEHLARPAEQPGRRLTACCRDDLEVQQQLVAAEAARGAGLVGELGVEQLGHDVV